MADTNNNKQVLVTGGTGFVGIHCIVQLMQQGYKVRTTVRSLKRKEEVLDMLKTGGIAQPNELDFIEADLTSDNNWNEAVKGCDYVLHVASPIFLKAPKDENEMIRPAVEGTIRVLKAARDAGVKRVVLTSSFAAVGYSNKNDGHLITETLWTNPDEKNLNAYLRSKTLAEKAAWNFMEKEGGNLELAVINPAAIFGPSLGPDISSAFEILKQLLEGKMKAIPEVNMGIVDVRDVADLHLKAMTNPAAKGERFLALSGGVMSLKEVAQLLRDNLGDKAARVTKKTLPNWLLRVAALFSPTAKNVVSQLGRNKNASNEKAKKLLGWQPRSNEEAVLASAESLFRFGLIKNEKN